ncbi:MAG TPA: bifunctional biotin--[acetyl-CoA-carboxylase] ligase/biotin operon repressor BirA [Gammaproteobacteria bacterium]|nr:bifunctional biotin--[acetyl-CoA-carboxylase] ligase/biotin operon repressor BirA [Gammaproteobacteria bacterium]
MSFPYQLVRLLADGRFHSGEALGAALGMSRGGVWKALRGLDGTGLQLHPVRGKGYRLARPLELLDVPAIRAAMEPSTAHHLTCIEVHPELASTSDHLRSQAQRGAPSGSVCIAEQQHAGRGRHGRVWISPFGANLYISLLWRFLLPPAALGGLSLAVGVALVGALRDVGVDSVELKWPNDVVCGGRKLAGILLDLAGESSGPCSAVIGVGVNVEMPAAAGARIDQPWTDLMAVAGAPVSRNRLAGRVLHRLALTAERFAREGFAPFLDEWREVDAAAGKTVDLLLPDRTVSGRAEGVDPDGALVLQIDGERHRFVAGELRLRVRP